MSPLLSSLILSLLFLDFVIIPKSSQKPLDTHLVNVMIIRSYLVKKLKEAF